MKTTTQQKNMCTSNTFILLTRHSVLRKLGLAFSMLFWQSISLTCQSRGISTHGLYSGSRYYNPPRKALCHHHAHLAGYFDQGIAMIICFCIGMIGFRSAFGSLAIPSLKSITCDVLADGLYVSAGHAILHGGCCIIRIAFELSLRNKTQSTNI